MTSAGFDAEFTGARGHAALYPLLAAVLLLTVSGVARAEVTDSSDQSSAPLLQVSDAQTGPTASPGPPPPPASAAQTKGGGEGVVHRNFWLTGDVDLGETYTTNALGVSSEGNPADDFVTRGRVDLGLHDHSARFTADADYSFTADYYARTNTPTRISNFLTALAKAEILPEHLFLAGRAFAQPIYLSRLGALTATDRALPSEASNVVRDTYGFDVDPQFTFLLGDFARSDTTAAYGAVFFEQPNGTHDTTPLPPDVLAPPQNTRTWTVSEQLSSGPDFHRLHWTLLAMDQEQSRDVGGLVQRTGLADASFAVSHQIYLLGRVGYESFDASPELSRNLNGVVAMGGLRFSAGPTFDASLQVGRMFNATSFLGDLNYQMSPRTTITGTLTDSVTTPGQGLLNNLNNLASNSEGQLYDTNYQLSPQTVSTFSSFNPVSITSGTFDNTISRYRQATLSFLFEGERTHLRATAFGSIRDLLTPVATDIVTQQKFVGASVDVSRDIFRNLRGTIGGTYSIQDVFGGHDRIFQATGDLTYGLSEDTFLYARAAYVQRWSSTSLTQLTPAAGDLTDTEITIGIRRVLF